VGKLPVVSGKEVVRRLEHTGFVVARRVGSHIILRRDTPPKLTLTVPDHKELKKGTLRAILRQAGISLKQFESL
jgi:predicted RNA binding protein YcfA (HicA-like mRNA interferase family)